MRECCAIAVLWLSLEAFWIVFVLYALPLLTGHLSVTEMPGIMAQTHHMPG
jgi:hypothetical protein